MPSEVRGAGGDPPGHHPQRDAQRAPAAAQSCGNGDGDEAAQVARYTEANVSLGSGTATTSGCGDGEVSVTVTVTGPSYFAGIFGVRELTASASATAGWTVAPPTVTTRECADFRGKKAGTGSEVYSSGFFCQRYSPKAIGVDWGGSLPAGERMTEVTFTKLCTNTVPVTIPPALPVINYSAQTLAILRAWSGCVHETITKTTEGEGTTVRLTACRVGFPTRHAEPFSSSGGPIRHGRAATRGGHVGDRLSPTGRKLCL